MEDEEKKREFQFQPKKTRDCAKSKQGTIAVRCCLLFNSQVTSAASRLQPEPT